MMTLQQVFIGNLKKFRRARRVSQMALAELCDTSGNYIGEIEMGRRIPSFEKIEKIASALRINPYELFVREAAGEGVENHKEKDLGARDFLEAIPPQVREEIIIRLLTALRQGVTESFDPGNY
jgi:transcriptional regulator with XRE-family HTH domain